MRGLIIILLCFKLSFGFSQIEYPIIISNDGNHLLLFNDGPANFTATYYLELYQTDSLHDVIESFILKEDTIFTLHRSYPGQRGFYYYENERKSYNVIFDTLMMGDLCAKYNMDPKNLILPKTLQFKLDTIRYHKPMSREEAIYCNDEFDGSDTSTAIKFNYHLIFNNIEIQNDTLELTGDYILNSVKNDFARIYLDEKHQLFFMNAIVELEGCRLSEDTYEIYTLLVPMRLKVFENVFW